MTHLLCETHRQYVPIQNMAEADKMTSDLIEFCGQSTNRAIIGIMAHTFTSYPARVECCGQGRYAIYLAAASWRTALAGESA